MRSGPFTSVAEVEKFLSSNLSESEKVARLYLEVRYARDTSVSLPKSSDVFKLKKGYKNLDSTTYGKNLIVFFEKIICNTNVNMADFEKAIEVIYT